jgi:hypothetical protein
MVNRLGHNLVAGKVEAVARTMAEDTFVVVVQPAEHRFASTVVSGTWS